MTIASVYLCGAGLASAVARSTYRRTSRPILLRPTSSLQPPFEAASLFIVHDRKGSETPDPVLRLSLCKEAMLRKLCREKGDLIQCSGISHLPRL